MATLAFTVQADYDKVRRLSEELARLKTELRAVEENGTPEAVEKMEKQISSCRAEMKNAVKAAADLGASMEESVRQGDFSTVEGQIATLTLAIHENEQVIGQTEQRVAELKTQYEQALSAGDTQAVEAITRKVREQMLQFIQLTQQTDEYRQALSGLTEGGIDTSLEGVRKTYTEVGLAASAEADEITRLKEEYQKLQPQLVMHVQQGTQEHKNILERMQAIDGEITTRRRLLNELKEQDAALEESIARMEKEGAEVKKASEQHASLRTQIRLLKEQMADMRANGIDEQSEAYRKLSLELGRLLDIQGDIQRQGSILANDESQFAGITSGLQGLSSGFYAVSGAMAMFGTQNQKLQAVLSKTYSLMAVVNSLQQVAAMLNKDSAFRLVTLANAREWWNKVLEAGRGTQVADTAATQANTVAKQANTAAQTGNATATGVNTAAQTAQTGAAVAGTAANIGLAGAFRMVGAAIKSIPVFGWIAAAIGAIVAVTATFIKRANEAKKAAQEFYKALAEEVYKPVAVVRQLAYEWEKLGDSLEAKQKYLDDNREKFDALGVSIRNVNDADKLLVDNADAFIQAQLAKAKATVLLQQAMDKTKELAELQLEIETMPDTVRTRNGGGTTSYWTDEKNYAKVNKQAQAEQLDKDIREIWDKVEEYNKQYEDTLSNAGISATEKAVEGSVNKIKEQIQSLQKDLDNNYKVGSDEYNKRKKQIEELQKQLNTDSGTTGSSTKATDNSKKEAKEREKLQKQLNEQLLSLQQQNQQAEIDLMDEGTEKKLAQIGHSYKLQIAKVEELAKEMAEANAKAGVTGTNENGLTREQQEGVDRATQNVKEARIKAEQAVYDAERDAMQAFLMEYGTYQQKKLAITQEYEKKIAEAQTEGERMTLGRQRAQALGNLDTEALKLDIDWATVFSDFGGLLGTVFSQELNKLRDYRKTPEFENLDARSQNEIVSAIDRLEKSLGGGNLNFKQLGKDMEAYQKSLRALNEAKKLEQEAEEELVRAQDELTKAMEDGTDAEIEEAQERVKAAQENADAQAQAVQMLQVATENTKNSMVSSAEQLRTGMQGVTQGLSQMTSGGLANAFNGTIQAISAVNKSFADLVQSSKSVPFVGWVLSILDMFSDGLSNFTEQIMTECSDVVNNILGDIISGDFFKTLGEQSWGAIATLFDTLSFGAISRAGESDRHYEEDMERLSLANDALSEAVNHLAEVISDCTTSIAEASEAYATQVENINEQMLNTQQQMIRSGSSYSNGVWGIGGSHSSNKHIDDAMSVSEWEKISEVAGVSVQSASDFWGLSSEQMYKVRTEASTLYAKIKQYADDGYRDAAQYMDDYTEYWMQLQELTDEYKEKLTNTSFDSLADSFKSAVSDMSHTAADFADDFEEIMKNAVIDSLMTSKYNSLLEQWYEDFEKAMESDGTLTSQEQQDLKDSYMDIVNDARNEIEGLYDTLGWSKSGYAQQGSSGGWESMSEDTGQELNGRFTALQETGVELLSEARLQTQWAERIFDINAEIQPILANSYLELQMINENTANAVEQLVAIAKQAKLVKANTDKL